MNVLVINCGSSSLKFQLIEAQSEKLIAKGICDYYGVDVTGVDSDEKINAPEKTGTLYVVQSGAFSSKSNAENLLQKLKKAGFDGFITIKN